MSSLYDFIYIFYVHLKCSQITTVAWMAPMFANTLVDIKIQLTQFLYVIEQVIKANKF